MVASYFRFQHAHEMGNWIRVEFESQEALEEAISDLFRDVELEGFERRTDEPPEYAAQRQARRDRRFLVAADASSNQSHRDVSCDVEPSFATSRTFHTPFIGVSSEGRNVQPTI